MRKYKQGEKVRVIDRGNPNHCLHVGSICVVVEERKGASGYWLRGPHYEDGRKVYQIVNTAHIEKIDEKNVSLKNLLERDY